MVFRLNIDGSYSSFSHSNISLINFAYIQNCPVQDGGHVYKVSKDVPW
jgi:hypothetical protein